ncbi:hypothetical protein SLA2020_156800 [Shorea laevis]
MCQRGEGPIIIIGSIAPVAHLSLCWLLFMRYSVLLQWFLEEQELDAYKIHLICTTGPGKDSHRHEFVQQHAGGNCRKSAVISWMISFFKKFLGSVSKSDYIALREGFIMIETPSNPKFDFHKYMIRTLGMDFKKVVSISWYL